MKKLSGVSNLFAIISIYTLSLMSTVHAMQSKEEIESSEHNVPAKHRIDSPSIVECSKTKVTRSQVKESAEATVKIFLDQPYGDYQIESERGRRRIGSLKFGAGEISIIFRGAKGFEENFSCIKAGRGPIHAGFLEGYNDLKTSLFDGIEKYITTEHISGNDIKFLVTGQSRGGGFVPQSVEEIKRRYPNTEVPTSIVFSPLGVYNYSKAQNYNTLYGNMHTNFLANEDIVPQYVQSAQKTWSWGTSEAYEAVGNTIKFAATSFPEFNRWVQDNPYIHLASYGWLLKRLRLLTPVEWGSHMPESYAMLAYRVVDVEANN